MSRGFKSGGTFMAGGDALPEDILFGKTAYVGTSEITGTMPNNGSVSTDITAVNQNVSIQRGYHDGSGIVKINTTDQGKLIASNIRKDVTILGVTGSLEEGVDTSDANAVAGNILNGKIGYVKGVKVTGNIGSKAATTITPSTSAQTAVSASTYCSGNITVNAIPNQQNGGSWTPSTSAQTMVTANKYLKTAVTVAAIPNQTDGGTKYATTSAQTLISAPKYLKTDLKIGALSQSGISAANILRGKTITISNGSTNVWSVSGSNDTLKMVSGSMNTGTTNKKWYWGNGDNTGYDVKYISITNHGITPLYTFSLSYGGFYLARTSASQWDGFNGSGGFGNNNPLNSGWRFTSSAIDIPGTTENETIWYWIWGY